MRVLVALVCLVLIQSVLWDWSDAKPTKGKQYSSNKATDSQLQQGNTNLLKSKRNDEQMQAQGVLRSEVKEQEYRRTASTATSTSKRHLRWLQLTTNKNHNQQTKHAGTVTRRSPVPQGWGYWYPSWYPPYWYPYADSNSSGSSRDNKNKKNREKRSDEDEEQRGTAKVRDGSTSF